MRQVPLELDVNIAINGCSGFATSTQKGPFMAMLISCSRGTYLIAIESNRGSLILPFRLVCDYGFIATGRTLFDCGETEEAAGQATCAETMAFVIGNGTTFLDKNSVIP